MTSYVSLRVGHSRGMLAVKRQPKYLRFVIQGTDWKTLDALDQLDDTPRDGEHVIPAVKGDRGVMHVDGVRKNGRRFGEWYEVWTYVPIPNPPPQDVLRDTARWQAWCLEIEAKAKVEDET